MTIDLLPRESILWEGRPVRRRFFRVSDLVLMPIGLVLISSAGGVLAYGWRPSRPDGPFSASSVALAGTLVLCGLVLIAGRVLVRALDPRLIRYLVTDRRLLVVKGDQVSATFLHKQPPAVFSERPDGSGTVSFGRAPDISDAVAMSRSGRRLVFDPRETQVLWNVPDVRRVHELVAAAQRQVAPRQ